MTIVHRPTLIAIASIATVAIVCLNASFTVAEQNTPKVAIQDVCNGKAILGHRTGPDGFSTVVCAK